MAKYLVTPKKEINQLQLVTNLSPSAKKLRFHRLSKLLKRRSRELMAKFFGFFRKSNKTWSYDTLTVEKIESFMEELSAPKILLPSIATLTTSTIRKMDWSTEVEQKACEPCEEICECEEECDDDFIYNENCDCEDCCDYKEDTGLEYGSDYTESEYNIKVECKPDDSMAEFMKDVKSSTRRRRGKLSAIKGDPKQCEPKKWYGGEFPWLSFF